MIDTELKNRLIEIYKDAYRNTLISNSSPWKELGQGELVGVTKVLVELGLVDDMGKSRLDICANIKESL